MKFELTILGCGSATPTLARHPTAQLLNIQEKYFLVDCGEGTQLQLRRYKVRFQRIERIFISHLHGDHYLGLIGLISTLHLLGRTKELHLHGPPPLQEIIEGHLLHSGTYLRFPLHFHPLEKEGVVHEDNVLRIETIRLDHRIPCWGFLFREKPKKRNIRKDKIAEYGLTIPEIRNIKEGAGHKDQSGRLVPNEELTLPPPRACGYAFCSDTRYDEELPEKLRDIDVLYHEATFLKELEERARETYHSTAGQAGKVAKEAGVRRLILGHYSARYRDTGPFLEEARECFPRSELAWDGKVIRVDEE